VIGAQNQICVQPRLSLFPLFALFAAISICLPFAPLREFFLILLVAGRTNHLSLFTFHISPYSPGGGYAGINGGGDGSGFGCSWICFNK
jgi:hypothetical protein